jgi:hypothetical protein
MKTNFTVYGIKTECGTLISPYHPFQLFFFRRDRTTVLPVLVMYIRAMFPNFPGILLKVTCYSMKNTVLNKYLQPSARIVPGDIGIHSCIYSTKVPGIHTRMSMHV